MHLAMFKPQTSDVHSVFNRNPATDDIEGIFLASATYPVYFGCSLIKI